MKVLQIHNFYRTRGGECCVVEAERKLLEAHGHEVLQFTADSRNIDKMPLGAKVLSYLQIPWNYKEAGRLDAYLKKQKPDIAHVHNVFPILSPSIYAALKRNNILIVQTVHNYRVLCPNGLFFTGGRVCEACRTGGFKFAVWNRCMHGSISTSALYALAISRGWRDGGFVNLIDCFIALNQFTANKLSEAGIPEEKIAICGNFIVNFAETPTAKKDYTLFLGRLSPEKGLKTLLIAARLVQDLRIKIAGSGPFEEELRVALRDPSLKHVEFLGYITGDRKRHLLSEAVCSVFPSECYETFGLTIIESMALGTPIVASLIGGIPEIVEHGKNGLLFKTGDPSNLAECLKAMFQDPQAAQEMSLFALKNARERFSPDRHLKDLMAIYASVLSGRTSSGKN